MPIEGLDTTSMDCPPPLLYKTMSPVFRSWLGKKIPLFSIKTWVTPAPGFEKKIVDPIPTPLRVPIPKDSLGSK